jgi:Rap1a immunity proteins
MVTSRVSSHPLTGGLVTKMSRAALMCCTALALALSVGAAHAGPEIPWQFHGRWCSQEHKYGTDTLIFGRQGSVADCNMEISRHALVAGGSQFTVQCEPLEIILRRDYRYQYKGKCSVFDKTAKKDLGAPSIIEGTAWITASNLLVIKSKPKPESKEEEPKETAPAAKPEPTAREHPSYPSTAWVAECSTPAKVVGDNVNTCRAYIHGLINALAIWQYVSPETAIVCIPAGADFGKLRDQILPQVKKQARPDISASVLLTHVLSEHFSCQPKT